MTIRERPDLLNAPQTSDVTGSRLLAGLAQQDSPTSQQTIDAILQPRLVVVRGETLNVSFNLLDGKNYVGRSADVPVDVDLDGQESLDRIWTSRRHAVITKEKNQFLLEDLNSLNGTFVNRTRIHPGQRHYLQPGDVIQIGTVQLRFQV